MSKFVFWRSLWPPFRSRNIDNLVFKLYYRWTVLILLAFSFVITCRLLFGYSFSCSGILDLREVTSYCYFNAPYIVISALSKRVGEEVPHPGVTIGKTPDEKISHMGYYPWVNLFFLALAVLFYLPHLLCKFCEGGLMTRLTSKVNDTSISEFERKAAVVEIAKYIIVTRGGHLLYAGAHVLSELFNFFVGIVLTALLVKFFNASFSSEDFQMETWENFFSYNFPMVAQCDFHRYGASGDVQRHSTMCLLHLNKLYGYMFLFLYAWFVFLCVIGALNLPDRVLGLVFPPIRLLLFRFRSGLDDQSLLNFINTHFSLGDWFLLKMLQKNLHTHDLTRILTYVQQNFNKSSLEIEMDDIGKLG